MANQLDLDLAEAKIESNIKLLKEMGLVIDDVASKSLNLTPSKKGVKEFDELTKSVKELQDALASKKDLEERTKKLEEELSRLRENKKKQLTEEERLTARLNQLKNGEKDATIKLQAEINKESKARRENAKESVNELNAFQKLSKERTKAQIEVKNLIALYGEQDKRTKSAITNFNKLNDSFEKINQVAKDGRPFVGQYGRALSGIGSISKELFSSLGLIGGITAVASLLRDSFNIIKDYEVALDTLRAVSGATEKEIESLEQVILTLGRTTSFTSKEVADASVELSKLGFTTTEIEQSLESILIGSQAMGSGIAETAELASKTLNAFGLEATETERVMSALAVSGNKTATDFTFFAEALPYASTSAKQLGFTVEETATFLGVLADNGLKASQSGTALRSIFLELSKRGITLDKALEEIAKSTNKGKTAFDLFGEVASSAGIILADNKDKFDELTASITDQGDELKKLAEIRTDNLAGDIDRLTGAWEGFILSLEKGDNVISNTFRTLITGLTNSIEGFRLFFIGASGRQAEQEADIIQTLTDKYTKLINKKLENNSLAFEASGLKQNQITQLNINGIEKEILAIERSIKAKQEEIKLNEEGLKIAIKQQQQKGLIGAGETGRAEFEANISRDKEQLLRDEARLKALNNIKTVLNNNLETERKLAEEKAKEEAEKAKKKAEEDKKERKLTGAIEIQQKKVSDLRLEKERASEENIASKTIDIEKAEKELQRLIELGQVKKDNLQLDFDEIERLKRLNLITEEYIREKNKIIFSEVLSEEQKNEAIEKLDIKYDNEELKLQKITLEKKLQNEKLNAQEIEEIKSELLEIDKSLQNNVAISDKKSKQKALDREAEFQQNVQNLIEETTDKAIEGQKRRSEARIKAIEQDINASERQQDIDAELIARGNTNAIASLQKERDFVREQTEEIEKEKQKQIRTEALLSTLKVLGSYATQGAGAVPKTLADVTTLFSAVLSAIPSFKVGTELFDSTNNVDGQGGSLAVLHDGERVMTKEQNQMTKGLSNVDLAEIGYKFKLGELVPKNLTFENKTDYAVVHEIRELKKEITNLKQNPVFADVDLIKGVVKQQQRIGNRVITRKDILG